MALLNDGGGGSSASDTLCTVVTMPTSDSGGDSGGGDTGGSEPDPTLDDFNTYIVDSDGGEQSATITVEVYSNYPAECFVKLQADPGGKQDQFRVPANGMKTVEFSWSFSNTSQTTKQLCVEQIAVTKA